MSHNESEQSQEQNPAALQIDDVVYNVIVPVHYADNLLVNADQTVPPVYPHFMHLY